MGPFPCAVCGRTFWIRYWYFVLGGYVQFGDARNTVSDLDDLAGGLGPGLKCLCGDHLEAGHRLIHLKADEAIEQIRREAGIVGKPAWIDEAPPELWITRIGPNRGAVFGVLRRHLTLAPAAAKALMDQKTFRVASGVPVEFKELCFALIAAHALVEVRLDGKPANVNW